MLQSIRDRTQGWLAWVVMILLGIAFGFWGVAHFVTNWMSPSNTIAEVNGQKISVDQFNVTYERLKRQLQLELGNNFVLNRKIETQIKAQTLQMLLTNTVLSQKTAKLGYRITPQQIDTILATMPVFQINGSFSANRFQTVLNALMYTEEAYIDQLRTDMVLNQLQTGLISTAFTLPNDVNNTYRLVNQTRDIQYIVIPHQPYMKNVQVSLSEQENYYRTHQNQFKVPEQIKLAYIQLSQTSLQAGLKFSSAEMQNYYQQNMDNFTIPAQWQIAHILVKISAGANTNEINQALLKAKNIRKQLQQGGDFTKIALQNSDDKLSAKNGGVLPLFATGALGNEIQAALMKMRPGKISTPILTPNGYEIIKLVAIKPRQIQPFDKVQAQVQKAMAFEKSQQLFATKSEQLSDLTYSNSASLVAAANALHVPIQTTEFFSRAGAKSGIANNPKVISAAFSQSVLAQGNNSDVVQLDPNTQIVVRVLQHKAASLRPFSTVSSEITKILTQNVAKQKAQLQGSALLQKIQQGETPESIAKNANLTVQKFSRSGRHASNIDTLILDKAFKLPRPKLPGQIASSGLGLPNGDYVIVMTSAVYDGDAKNMSDNDRKAYQQELASNYGRLDFALYIKQQMQDAKIKVEKKVVAAQVDNM